ncbi:MAG: 4Fe-4S binding protein [Phycisphaerales bacterium]|nr:4Fe-4S binding protein [Phycisphaerales bacterium]
MASIDPVSLPVLDSKPAPKIAKSRTSRWRFLVLAIIQLLIIIHVIQWLVMGTTVTPMEPSEAMQTVSEGVINVGTLLFGGALLSTLVLGRFFCGWGCHVILLQDACGAALKRFGLRPKPFRSRLLLWLPLGLALYMFVWPLVHRFAIAPWLTTEAAWPGFSWELTTTDFWSTFPGLAMAIPFLFVCGFLTVYLLGMKGYCTYACPYGGFFAPIEQASPVRIRVTDDCQHCGHCTAACTSNVRVHEEVWAHGMVVDPGCMKCMDCVSVCPNDALYVGWGKPAVAIPASERGTGKTRRFDMTWPEEITFALLAVVVLFSIRGAYSLPLLFASGVTAIVTWMAWKSWSTLRSKNAGFHSWRLKTDGRLRPGGIGFLLASGVVLLVILQTGVVNLVVLAARMYDDRVELPPQVVFVEHGIQPDEATAENARASLDWYRRAQFIGDGGWALVPSRRVEFAARQAWLHAVLREHDEALEVLDDVIASNGMVEDLALGRGRLVRLADPTNADAWYGQTLAEHPTYSRLRDERVTNILREVGSEAATAEARAGLEATPDELLAMRRLAVLLVDYGGPEDWAESARITRRTLELEPNHAGGWRALALALAKSGDLESADEAMQKAIALVPMDHRMREQYARLLNDRGLRKEAEAQMAESMRLAEEQGVVELPQPLPAEAVGPMLPGSNSP